MSNLTLYLRPPPSNFGVEDAAAASTLVSQRQQLHDKVERLFRDRCSRSMRGELKIYILQTLKQLRVDPSVSYAKFKAPLHSDNEEYIKSFLTALCKQRPESVGKILASQTEVFTSFFRDNPERIKRWFDYFHYNGKTDLGAIALEHYAFVHRDWFWAKHMVWRSARTVSPIIAAQQRQLLMHLDVDLTIKGLLRHNSPFWKSSEWERCLLDGKFLTIDSYYWVGILLDMWNGKRGERCKMDVYEMVLAYIHDTPYNILAAAHSGYLDDRQLEDFVAKLAPTNPSDPLLLESSIITHKNWSTIEDIALYLSMVPDHRSSFVTQLISQPEGDEAANSFLASFGDVVRAHFKQQESNEAEIASDIKEHWALRSHVFGKFHGDGSLSRQQCQFILLETVIVHLRLLMANLDRAAADALMLRESVAFEAIEEVPRKKRKKGKEKRKSEKRKKKEQAEREDSGEQPQVEPSAPPSPPIEKVFMGYRSPSRLQSVEANKKRKWEEMEEGEEASELAGPIMTLGLRDLPNFLADSFYDDLLEWVRPRM